MSSESKLNDGMVMTAQYVGGGAVNPRAVVVLSKQESGGSDVAGVCRYRVSWADVGGGMDAAARLPGGEDLGLAGEEFEALSKAGVCSIAGLYYRIDLPPAGGEMDAIVRMQAESVVPFSGEGMEVCWRIDEAGQGNEGVDKSGGREVKATIAACRSEGVAEAADVMGDFGFHCRILTLEAVAAGWYRFYGPVAEKGVVVYFNGSNVSVVLCDMGRLVNAVSFYSELAGMICGDGGGAEADGTGGGNYRLFVQDLCGAVERLGGEAAGQRLFVVCPEAGRFEGVISVLRESGVDAELSVFDGGRVDVGSCGCGLNGEIGEREFYELLPCAGASAKLLDGEAILDVFEDYNRRGESAGSTKLSRTVIKYAAGLLAMAIIFVFANYCLERAELGQIRELIYEKNAEQSQLVFSEKEQLRRLVAGDRAGVMGLLDKIAKAAPKGVLLDSFDMSRGRQVSVKGTAGSYEMLFEFQDKLGEQNSVEGVELRNPTFDEKSNKVSFEMHFDYKNFTKRR